ncbi:phage tail protein [Paramagnetospirillum magneticum]|uniref:Microcystin-dependent protein n=1 Tax=Paramagnetospirillum magneticum (strain ATCC 700264 / AMB-1) TaxID=342108 RepID=Q2W7B1_PARM1|nr:tail fiber protein [Paramagnetospirillum magneticum]BAE50264.1 Microcystin-dependent protein [Paramagnetospirillum magneticum AMB-1]
MTEAFLGEIRLFPLNWAPTGWLPCDGRSMQVSANAALFSLLGNQFGGDAKTTFFLPDLRGRTIMGQGKNPVTGVSYVTGAYGGTESVTLTTAQLPSHQHQVVGDQTVGATNPADDNYLAVPIYNGTQKSLYNSGTKPVPLNPASVSTVGGGAAHTNTQPYLALGYCICTSGYYPPRP